MPATIKQLESLVDRINQATGSPAKPFVAGLWQVGNYHLAEQYGGVCLHRVVNAQGGVKGVLGLNFGTKTECFSAMQLLLLGVEK